jgi:uncharacterized protein
MSGALGVSSGGALVPLAVLFLNVDQQRRAGNISGRADFSEQLDWAASLREARPRLSSAMAVVRSSGIHLRGHPRRSVREANNERRSALGIRRYLVVLETALIIRHRSARDRMSSTAHGPAVTVTKLFLVGLAAGASSGLLGIGGDLAMTALASGGLKVPQHQSQALSLAATALPLTLPAAWTYLERGVNVPSLASSVCVLVRTWARASQTG